MGRTTGKRSAIKCLVDIIRDKTATIDQRLAAAEIIQKMGYTSKKKKEKKKKQGLLG